jgi:hypothetical protein
VIEAVTNTGIRIPEELVRYRCIPIYQIAKLAAFLRGLDQISKRCMVSYPLVPCSLIQVDVFAVGAEHDEIKKEKGSFTNEAEPAC